MSFDPDIVDGRTRRSERSRQAIVQALFDLLGEGIPVPTAQQVADRAGVGIRSVFRHFSHMETLYAAVDKKVRGLVRSVFGDPIEGAIEKRAAALIAERASAYERLRPYIRASQRQRWNSTFVEAKLGRVSREMRENLLTWLPELETSRATVREGVELATSPEAWDQLRSEQGLGQKRARAVVEKTVLALLSAG